MWLTFMDICFLLGNRLDSAMELEGAPCVVDVDVLLRAHGRAAVGCKWLGLNGL